MKNVFLLCIILIAGMQSLKAQDNVICNFEEGMPFFGICNEEQKFELADNPLKDAVNASDKVGKYTHKVQYCNVGFFPEANSGEYPTVELKVYGVETGYVAIECFNSQNQAIDLYEYTITEENLGKWIQLQHAFPFVGDIDKLAFSFSRNEGSTEGKIVYMDDLILKKNTSSETILYAETFTHTKGDNWSGPASELAGQWVGGIDLQCEGNIHTVNAYGVHGYLLRLPLGSSPVIIPDILSFGYDGYKVVYEQSAKWEGGDFNMPDEQCTLDVKYQKDGAEWENATVNALLPGAWETQEFYIDGEAIMLSLQFGIGNSQVMAELDNIKVYGLKNTGIGTQIKEIELTLYPNPVIGQLYADKSVQKIDVLTLSGTLAVSVCANTVSLQNLPAGIYLVKLYAQDGVATKKIVKK